MAVFAPAPQRNAPSRAIPRFRGRVASYPLLAFERRSWAVWPWAFPRPCPALKPRDRRATRARETRGSLRRTLVARPALAVAISAPSLLTPRWAKAARIENASQKSRDAPRVRPPTCAGDSPLYRQARLPIIVGAPDQTGTSPLAPGPNRNEERCREELKPTMLIRRIASRGSWR
jgi:hypothetical protein